LWALLLGDVAEGRNLATAFGTFAPGTRGPLGLVRQLSTLLEKVVVICCVTLRCRLCEPHLSRVCISNH
jgi:phosphopantetheine adenylyltransferase